MNFFSINFDEVSVVSIVDVSLMDFNFVDTIYLISNVIEMMIVITIYSTGDMQTHWTFQNNRCS